MNMALIETLGMLALWLLLALFALSVLWGLAIIAHALIWRAHRTRVRREQDPSGTLDHGYLDFQRWGRGR